MFAVFAATIIVLAMVLSILFLNNPFHFVWVEKKDGTVTHNPYDLAVPSLDSYDPQKGDPGF